MLRTPVVSALVGRCQICGTDGSTARMNSVWRGRKEIRYHTVCGICSHLFGQGELKPHPFRQTHMSALATDGWWSSRVGWSPVGGADGRGRFLRPAEAEDILKQLRGGIYLASGVTERMLAPRRALLRGDGPALDAASVFTAEMFALGVRQHDLEVERAREEERRRRRGVLIRRRRKADEEQILQPELPAEKAQENRPVCAGCYKPIETDIAYTADRFEDLLCKACAREIYRGLRSAEAVAHRVSLVPVVEEPAGPVVEAAAVEIAPEPAPGVEKPAEVAVVASPTEPKPELDPAQAAAREDVSRLLGNGSIRARLTQPQLDNVKWLYDREDFVRALTLLRAMIEASVERPVAEPKPVPAECERPNCHRLPWTEKGPFADVHDLGGLDPEIAAADGKYVCWECRGELIARTKRLLAERPTPSLERREPLAAKGGAGEREVKPAVVHATA